VTATALKGLHETLEKKVIIRTKDLAEAKAKEGAILQSIGDGFLVTDEKGKIVRINKTAEKLFGKSSKEVMGKVFYKIILMEDEKGISIPVKKRPISLALAGGTTTTTTTTITGPAYYYVRTDKTKFPVAIMVAPVILDGKIVGTIEIFRDITREKEIDTAKSEFISLASHQLKTPPTAIKLLTERLLGSKMGTFTKKQGEYFNDIRSSNQRMIDIINALLSVSRIELGSFYIEISKKDACAIVNNILDESQAIIDKKNLKLKSISLKKSAMIMLDESLFRMIIVNLITNAINYTAEGGEIQVECRIVNKGQVLGGKLLEKNCFVVVVSDTGCGIPQKDQIKIFTKFFRADNAREKHTDGTGLGLYIVKSILDHSGGSIWFTSCENEGSIFYAAIPMAGMKVKDGGKMLIH
jgi:PAS domain S-box-containing protein